MMMIVVVFLFGSSSEICEAQGCGESYYHRCDSDEHVCAVPDKLMKHVVLICW